MGKRPYSSTSFIEQAIFYYVVKIFPDAVNRYQFKDIINRVAEADIFIPSISVAIEYDGSYWHKLKQEEDAAKNVIFNESNIFVIRIRESDLPELPQFHGVVLDGSKRENEIISDVISVLLQYSNGEDPFIQISLFSLSEQYFSIDAPDIYASLFLSRLEENATDLCGVEFWDYDRNGRLKPECVPSNANVRAWFLCPEGTNTYASMQWLKNRHHCAENKTDCINCVFRICPFLYSCRKRNDVINCNAVSQAVEDYLFGTFDLNEVDLRLFRELLSQCAVTVKMMELRINGKLSSEKIFRFNDLFFGGQGTKYFLCGKPITSIRDRKALEILKKFHLLYPDAYISVFAKQFDDCSENRDALISYIEWRVDFKPIESHTIIKSIFSADLQKSVLSDDMKKKVKALVARRPEISIYDKYLSDALGIETIPKSTYHHISQVKTTVRTCEDESDNDRSKIKHTLFNKIKNFFQKI